MTNSKDHEQAVTDVIAEDVAARNPYLQEIAEALGDKTLTSVAQIATGIRDVVSELHQQLADVSHERDALRADLSVFEPVSDNTRSKREKWLENIRDAIKIGLPKQLVSRLEYTAKGIEASIKYGGTSRVREELDAIKLRLSASEARNAEQQILLACRADDMKAVSVEFDKLADLLRCSLPFVQARCDETDYGDASARATLDGIQNAFKRLYPSAPATDEQASAVPQLTSAEIDAFLNLGRAK